MALLQPHLFTWPQNNLLFVRVLGKELIELTEGDSLVRVHVDSFEYAFEHIAVLKVFALHIVRNAKLLLRKWLGERQAM